MNILAGTTLIFLCCLFTVSGAMKFFHFRSFIELVEDYRLLPESISRIWGFLIPFLEISAALMLLSKATFHYGISIIVLLLVSFGYAITKVMKANRVLSCGCYGSLFDAKAGAFTLVKNSFLGIAAVFLWIAALHFEVQFAIGTMVLGIFATVIYFLVHMVWSKYEEAVESLRETK